MQVDNPATAVAEAPNRPGVPPSVPVLEAVSVCKEVSSPEGPLTIVDDVTFSIAAGETVAIVGPSGAGKSTLLALLAGLDVPTRGTVRLTGHDLGLEQEDGRARLRARYVGFVFQAFHLLPALTAIEQVMLPLELAGAPDARDRAAHALAQVGLTARARHYPRQLSGGEQQRIALARAFVTRPMLLFADEPTGNLDALTGAAIAELLFGMNAAHGTTLVLVTHERALADRCARRLELAAGRLVSA